MDTLKAYASSIATGVAEAIYSTKDGNKISDMEAVRMVLERLTPLKISRGKVLFVGNGGSASICGHFAEDFTKMAGLRGMCFNDGPLLTCLANDFSFEEVFQKAIEFYADKSDVLFAISSSGKSMNIRNAVLAAERIGCFVITLSGFQEENPLSSMGNLNIHVPSSSYGVVESAHSVIIHGILDFFVQSKTDTA